MAVICTTIRKLAAENMCVAGAYIQVFQLSRGPNIWPLSLEIAGILIKLYAFKEEDMKFPLTVHVSIIDRGSPHPLTADRVLVEVDGEWCPLKEWLVEWVPPSWVMRTRRHASLAQRKWWQKSGRPFPLMDLPPNCEPVFPTCPRRRYTSSHQV
jgi:hypothetical protein